MSKDRIRSFGYVAEFLLKEKKGVTKKEKKKIEQMIRDTISNRKNKDDNLEFPDEVIAFFTPLMKNIIKRKMSHDRMNGIMQHNDDYSDLVQEAYSGLLYGLSKYDIEKTNSPTTYVHYWISNFIQKSRSNLNNIVRPDSVYHPLYVFVRKHLEDNLNVDQILEFFPKAENKKNGDWVYPPENVKINHSTIKRSTVIKHINHVLNGTKSSVITPTEENESYIEFEIFKSNEDNSAVDFNLGGKSHNFSMYEFKDSIISHLKTINKFSDNEKNLFIEYFNLGKPVFLVLPNILTMDSIKYSSYSVKRKKVSKGLYFSEKYNISRNRIKKIIEEITNELKPIIKSQLN